MKRRSPPPRSGALAIPPPSVPARVSPPSPAAELFAEWNAGKAPATVKAHFSDLRAWSLWAFDTEDLERGALGLLGMGELGAKHKVMAWHRYMIEAGLADTTRARRIVSIRGLVEAAGTIAQNRGQGYWSLAKVKPPGFSKHGRKPGPPAAKVERAIARIDGRSLAIVLLCYDAGLRVNEACTLRVDAIDWKKNSEGQPGHCVRVHRKRKGLVRRSITDRAAAALRVAIAERPAGRKDPYAFPGRAEGSPMSARAAHGLFERLDLGHPHGMRHAAATKLLRETKDLELVSDFLGHADLSTTQIYLDRQGDRAGEGSRILAGEKVRRKGR